MRSRYNWDLNLTPSESDRGIEMPSAAIGYDREYAERQMRMTILVRQLHNRSYTKLLNLVDAFRSVVPGGVDFDVREFMDRDGRLTFSYEIFQPRTGVVVAVFWWQN